MIMKPSVLVLIAVAALAFVAGCSDRGTSPSEPAGALVAALSPQDQALAAQIREDLRCVYDGDREDAALRKFQNAVNNFDRNRARTQQLLAELINQLYADLSEDRLSSCDEGEDVFEVVARLIDDMSDFGDLPNVDEQAIAEALEDGGSVKTFLLQRGGGDVLPDGCIGYFVPAQQSNRGYVTVILEEPANDPGFGSFPNRDTAPYWVVVTSTFGGPFVPKVRVGWFAIDFVGQFSKDPGAQPPPPGADVEACTIRNNQLFCNEDADLDATGGQLGGNLAINCETDTPSEFGDVAWRAINPFSRLLDVDPLWANPGNTGLRSSFASPFGVAFEEEEVTLIPTTTDLQPTSTTYCDFCSGVFIATVSPNPGGGSVQFTIDQGGIPQTFVKPVNVDGNAELNVECNGTTTPSPSSGNDAAVTYGPHTVDAEFLGSGTHSGSTASQATLDCVPSYGPS